jgi:hypothetical protein
MAMVSVTARVDGANRAAYVEADHVREVRATADPANYSELIFANGARLTVAGTVSAAVTALGVTTIAIATNKGHRVVPKAGSVTYAWLEEAAGGNLANGQSRVLLSTAEVVTTKDEDPATLAGRVNA